MDWWDATESEIVVSHILPCGIISVSSSKEQLIGFFGLAKSFLMNKLSIHISFLSIHWILHIFDGWIFTNAHKINWQWQGSTIQFQAKWSVLLSHLCSSAIVDNYFPNWHVQKPPSGSLLHENWSLNPPRLQVKIYLLFLTINSRWWDLLNQNLCTIIKEGLPFWTFF